MNPDHFLIDMRQMHAPAEIFGMVGGNDLP